jgi:chemotaxis protein CheC
MTPTQEHLPVTQSYTTMQLDALRELSNVASGTAATALSQLLGREVELSVPFVVALPLPAAVRDSGDEHHLSAVAIPVDGDLDAAVLMLIPPAHADTLCRLLGVEPGSELADSALREIGNILGAAYLGALGSMTGLSLFPAPPQLVRAGLGRLVGEALADRPDSGEDVLLLDSELKVSGEVCSLSFLLLPSTHSAFELLTPLGLAESTA